MADPKSVRLELFVQDDPGADADQVDRATRQLRAELRELDLGPVELRAVEAPLGAKAGEGFALGNLLMEVLPNAISPLIEFLKSWAQRRTGRIVKVKTVFEDRSVEMEFNPAIVSPAEMRSLVNSIIQKLEHAGG